MDKKRIWKRAFAGLLCVTLFMTNAVSVIAQETGNTVEPVSKNDVSGSEGIKGEEAQDLEAVEEEVLGNCVSGPDEIKEEAKKEENSPDISHNAVEIGNVEEAENIEETKSIEETEDAVQPFSLETGGYDISAADATYTAGENVTAYYFAADCTLVFEGSGAMTDWTTDSEVPWGKKRITAAIVEEGITTLGAYALSYHFELETLTLPNTLKAINNYAVCKKYRYGEAQGYLREINIPSGVERIGDYAFRGNSLESITIPDSVTYLGANAFAQCYNAKSLSIGSGLSEIGGWAFYGLSNVERIVIPGTVETIGESAFGETKATQIIISDGVKTIERGAFESCKNAEAVTIGNSVEYIGSKAFYECKNLKSLEIPDSVATIQSYAFWGCNSLSALTFGTGLTTISSGAFEGAFVLESLDIPDNVQQIGPEAFKYSRALKNISIGKGVRSFVYKVFMVDDMTETTVTTENRLALNYDWAGDKRAVSFQLIKHTATFKNYDGTILKEVQLTPEEIVLDKAPAVAREENGLSSYTFKCWEPALDETDKLTEDTVYTAKYWRKTQTGIRISNEINIPEGSAIGASDITAVPVYKIYDENNTLIKTMWEEETISGDDIRLSKDRIERGINEITVEQTSTGLTEVAEVFGSYIDGITVWQPPEELEAGTRLEELEVYFTWSMLDNEGEIQTGFPNIENLVKYTLSDADFVEITEGDNEIRVTETESGNKYQTVLHIRGVSKTASGSGTSGGDTSSNDTSDNDVSDNDTSDNNKPGGAGNSGLGNDTSGNDLSENDASGNDTSGNNRPGGVESGVSGNGTSANDASGNSKPGNDMPKNNVSRNDSSESRGDNNPYTEDVRHGAGKRNLIDADIPPGEDIDRAAIRTPESHIRHYEPVMPDNERQELQQESRRESLLDHDERKVEDGETAVKEKKECYEEKAAFFNRSYFWIAVFVSCIGIMFLICMTMESDCYIKMSSGAAFWRRKKKEQKKDRRKEIK